MLEAFDRSQGLGVERLFLICDLHNRAMQPIAEKVNADTRFEDGDRLAEIATPKIQVARNAEVGRAA